MYFGDFVPSAKTSENLHLAKRTRYTVFYNVKNKVQQSTLFYNLNHYKTNNDITHCTKSNVNPCIIKQALCMQRTFRQCHMIL